MANPTVTLVAREIIQLVARLSWGKEKLNCLGLNRVVWLHGVANTFVLITLTKANGLHWPKIAFPL